MANRKCWLTAGEKLALLHVPKKSDDEIVAFLIFYDDFVEKGNLSALLDAVYRCCILDGKPLYPWLKLALSYAYERGNHGEIRSWDEVFGKPTRYGTGKKIELQIKQEQLVLNEVARLKAEDKSLNEEEFEAIGRRLGVGAKSKVKELLREARLWTERLNWLYRRN
jgi:hypothetical protein